MKDVKDYIIDNAVTWHQYSNTGQIRTNVQGKSTLCAAETWMKSTATHHATTQVNKVWRVVVEKRLLNQKAASASSEKNCHDLTAEDPQIYL